MDAPQLPGAEASAEETGGQPPGQASAFRRALDAQIEPADPLMALVPSGVHDLTAPIDVSSLRAGLPAAPPGPPPPSGPTVVVPAVSVPALRAPTTITTARDDSGENSAEPPDHSPRHGGKPSRLPTTVGVSAVLAALAGVALVIVTDGHSTAPLAPTAMPTKAVTHSPAAKPPPPVAISHKASAPASPSHTTATPSHAATPSPSASPSRPVWTNPGTGGDFSTIYWTNDSQPLVADIQSRLARLNYLAFNRGTDQYSDSNRTLNYLGGGVPNPDGVGYYQNSTDSAIRAFEFEYLQHRRGQWPGGGCSSQTYDALVWATS